MIFNYSDFLVEKLVSMINESEVVYSDGFKKVLSTIESPISKILNDAESKDFDISNNYFDISDSKDSISFITDRKAKELLKNSKHVIYKKSGKLTNNLKENGEIFDLLQYTPSAFDPSRGDKGEIVSTVISPSSGKEYALVKFENGEAVINRAKLEIDEVWSKNRQTIKIGRAVRALLISIGQKFTDSEIEEFVNKYKSAFDRINDAFLDFDLVSGEDISFWYNSNNYLRITTNSTLSNSCMSCVDSDYFDIYVKNPDVCSLLILKSKEEPTKIKGRALVWKLTRPEGITFMDRVYTHDDSDVELFREYAKSKGWYSKVNMNSIASGDVITPEGDEKDLGTLETEIRSGYYDYYPYVDTLKYLDTDDGTLSTSERGICLEDTDGQYVGATCEYCGGASEVECYECEGTGHEECEECGGTGEVRCSNNCEDGKVKCDFCEGEGELDCPECDGSGSIDGEDCEMCSSSGKMSCPECDGMENVTCPECDGTEYETCDDCEGSGQEDCSRCDGSGYVDCPECN